MADTGTESDRDWQAGIEDRLLRVAAALAEGDDAALEADLRDLPAPDRADLIARLNPEARRTLAIRRPATIDGPVLVDLSGPLVRELGRLLPVDHLVEAMSGLDADDVLYVFDELDPDAQIATLARLPVASRLAVQTGLSFPEESAGRLMQRRLVAVPNYWTAGRVLDWLSQARELPDRFTEVFIVDPRWHPVGVLPLDRLVRCDRETAIETLMDADSHPVPATMDQEEVAFLVQRYHLLAVPVVDDAGRLIGRISVEDIGEVIEEEVEEDAMRLAGLREDDLDHGILPTARARLVWLVVNLGTALLASSVIRAFEDSIEVLVALAVLMPIVASLGGNAATQTLTVAVRALATRELTRANAWRMIGKEAAVGILNGVVLAILVGLMAWVWFGNIGLGGVIAAAMIINLFVAALVGIIVPITLARLKIDPAIASSVFVTTATDVVGFMAFLGLATWLLLGGLV